MPAPARGGDDLQGGLLQRARTKKSSTMRAARSRARPPASADAGHAQARRGRLGQRAHVDTWPSASSAASGGGGSPSALRSRAQSSSSRKAPASATPRAQRRGGRRRARSRAGWRRAAGSRPGGPGTREGLGEQVGAHAAGVAGDRDDAQPGGARRDDGAQVGGRLDEDGVAGGRQGAEGGRERGLAAGADDDVVGAQAPPASRVNQARSSSRPSTGPRSHAPGRRAARASAAPTR